MRQNCGGEEDAMNELAEVSAALDAPRAVNAGAIPCPTS
jgi:hypothetical protein